MNTNFFGLALRLPFLPAIPEFPEGVSRISAASCPASRKSGAMERGMSSSMKNFKG